MVYIAASSLCDRLNTRDSQTGHKIQIKKHQIEKHYTPPTIYTWTINVSTTSHHANPLNAE